MDVKVSRLFALSKSTLGVLSVDGKGSCFTLEDPHRDVKVKGATRIPAGSYDLELKAVGTSRFDASEFNKELGEAYVGMIRLKDVPGFSEVLIHPGNTADDTKGCLLVGWIADIGQGTIGGSRAAYRAVYRVIVAALKQ